MKLSEQALGIKGDTIHISFIYLPYIHVLNIILKCLFALNVVHLYHLIIRVMSFTSVLIVDESLRYCQNMRNI